MQTMYMTWVTMAIVFVLFLLVCKNPKMVPSGLQNAMEIILDFLNGLMEDNLGSKGRKFMAPFIVTLFMFILVANELGILLPQIGVHWTSPTNDINTCFALSLLIALARTALVWRNKVSATLNISSARVRHSCRCIFWMQ